ncbi:hypothetical protein PIROE2DRAFT_68699 [Piromyces sp. E2]|nr:hypothetical protein PIROE2DRAFT_68699 [Piromyces sp. E2]|eukprot:OUM68337.1 hypothetical protein PIROE2DRAFT_68699 [Piromyces sp. E2]
MSNSSNNRFISSKSKSSSRIEELASDYISSDDSFEKASSNYSKFNTSSDNVFQFDSSNYNRDISENNINGVVCAKYKDCNEDSSKYKLIKQNAERNNRQGRLLGSYGSSIPNFKTFEENMKSHNILDLLDYGRSRYLDDFVQIKRLGKGAFGAVFEAENKLDGLRYAVKIIRIPSLKDLFIDKIINEVKFLARLDHKNVVRYYSAWLDNDSPVFIISDDDDSELESDEDEDDIFETNDRNNNISNKINEKNKTNLKFNQKLYESETDTNTDISLEIEFEKDSNNNDTDSESDIETDSDLDTDSEMVTDSETETETDTESETESESDVVSKFHSKTKTQSNNVSEAETEITDSTHMETDDNSISIKFQNEAGDTVSSFSSLENIAHSFSVNPKELYDGEEDNSQSEEADHNNDNSNNEIFEDDFFNINNNLSFLSSDHINNSFKNTSYDNDLIFMMENETSQDDIFSLNHSFNVKINTKSDHERNKKISFSSAKSINEEEDNDVTLNSKPLNTNKTFDSFRYNDNNLSRSIPININRKNKWGDTKYSSSYIEREKLNQNTPHSFMSRSSKRPSVFSKATSNRSKNPSVNNKIVLNMKPKTNKKKKDKMQLCQATLYDYLQDRNKLLNESSNLVDEKGYPLIDEEENYHIWCDIIEGVKYIHSKGLIHRDIKPNNIFWVPNDPNETQKYKPKEGIWKLGDFGLMTSDMQNELGKFSNNSAATSSTVNDKKNNNNNSFLSVDSHNVSNMTDDSNTHGSKCTKLANVLPPSTHTIGIGTISYGSPEQLDVNNTSPFNYTVQSDIYPLGIILFELYFPFSTAMERAKAFYDLREKQILPEKFVKRFPQEAAIVLWLTQKDPNKRPTVNELYEWNISTIIKSRFSKQSTTKVTSTTDGITTENFMTNRIVINKEIDKNQRIYSANDSTEDMLLLSNFLELSMKDKIIKSKEEENKALKKQIQDIKSKEEENIALKKRIKELEQQLSNVKNQNK